jgi:hypothetical protein
VGASAGLALYPDCYGYEFVAALPDEGKTGERAAGVGRVAGGRDADGAATANAADARTTRLDPRGARPGTFPSCAASRRARCRCRRNFPRWCGGPGSTSTPWTCATG